MKKKKNTATGGQLVKICPPVQGSVPGLVKSPRLRATKLLRHNYQDHVAEVMLPVHRRAHACNRSSLCTTTREEPLLSATREPCAARRPSPAKNSTVASGSIQFSRSVVSNSLWPHGPQHARPPRPSPTPRVHPNPCPLSRWCHPAISSSVIPFSSRLQSFPALGSFQMSQLFASGGQSIRVSASTSVLSMNIQGWFPLGWTGWISGYR